MPSIAMTQLSWCEAKVADWERGVITLQDAENFLDLDISDLADINRMADDIRRRWGHQPESRQDLLKRIEELEGTVKTLAMRLHTRIMMGVA